MNINDYSSIKNHLVSFGRRRLEQTGETFSDGTKSRKKTVHAWYELQDTCAYHEEFSKEKLVWIELVNSGRFSYDDTGIYCEATCFMMTGQYIKYLTALLNSKLVFWFLSHVAPTSGMGVLRWKKTYVETIPIPKISPTAQAPFIQLVEEVLRKAVSEKDYADIEDAINNSVYRLYDLTVREISIIESATRNLN